MLPFITALTAPAAAYVYIGNPPLTVQVLRSEGDLTSGSAWLRGVRVHTCGGGYTDYTADVAIDPTEGWSTTITGGDLCGVTVRWETDVVVASSAFELAYEYPTSAVELTGSAYDQVALTPFVVESGTFSGSNPKVRITIGG
jgi:hypothetical protein